MAKILAPPRERSFCVREGKRGIRGGGKSQSYTRSKAQWEFLPPDEHASHAARLPDNLLCPSSSTFQFSQFVHPPSFAPSLTRPSKFVGALRTSRRGRAMLAIRVHPVPNTRATRYLRRTPTLWEFCGGALGRGVLARLHLIGA